MMKIAGFEYSRAFSRNLGLLTEADQALLKDCCVGLAGLGGVGGAHLQALVRMGVGAFHLADPDSFEVVNFNRQLGATMFTVGKPKTETLAATARSINPDARVATFGSGISPQNIDSFLEAVDVVVDGLDFFCMDARRMLYRECRERGIPVVNAGPIGFGAAVLVFTPKSASFEKFFNISDDMTRAEQLLAMALGLAPGLTSDIDPARVDIEGQKGPALASACFLCAAAAATEVLKLVCGRGQPALAPRGTYYDPYRGRTYPLRRRHHLRSLPGMILRWLGFNRYPALKVMHEREMSLRKGGRLALSAANAR